MNLRKSNIINLLLIILTVPLSLFSQSDTLEIPFLEDWSSGSLDTNGWTVSDAHWSINLTEGSPAPSIEFDGGNIGGLYYKELYSAVLNAEDYHVGDIWLSFDIKLKSNDSLEVGRLSIYGSNEGGWYNFKTINNNDGSFDWVNQKINITEIALDKCFQIKFKADGKDHSVDAWFIDNIHFYRTCDAPSDLAIEIDTVDYDNYQLNLNWRMDEPEIGWIHWDDGVNNSGVGTCPDCWFYAAARWDPGDLIDYDNYQISKIKAFLHDDKYDSLTFIIWEGATIEDQVYLSLHDTVIGAEWITDQIDTLIILHAENEYWVGYKVWLNQPANYPLGIDNGPAIAGYGDMISTDGISWNSLYDFGIDGNLNIHFYVEDTVGNEMQVGKMPNSENERNTSLTGYNLYQSINGADYELLEFIPWTPGDTTHSIPFEASPFLHCFQLTALWAIGTDTCESAPAISKDNPDEDYVCVLLVGEEDNKIEQSALVRCFPNPFSNSTTIEYTLKQASTIQISIFNHLGEQVGLIQKKQSSGKQQVVWEDKGLPSGMYYLIIETGS